MKRYVATAIGLVRRELLDLIAQPRLIAILVLGPFAILLLFGGGYRNETISLRTIFVAPEGYGIEETIESNQESIEDYVVPVGYTSDVVSARDDLVAGNADLVVVFPADAVETIRAGEQAEIAILHDKIDPIQGAAVEIASQVAVNEINAAILTEIVVAGQGELEENESDIDRLVVLAERVQTASQGTDDEELAQASAELDRALGSTAMAAQISSQLLDGVETDSESADEQERLDRLQSDVAGVRTMVRDLQNDPSADDAPAQAVRISNSVADLSEPLEDLTSLPADVIVQPFTYDAEGILGRFVTPVDFFVPSALALLIQHAGMTFGALTLVRDRSLGLMEVYRVGSTPVSAMLLGKAVAFFVIGAFLSAALLGIVAVGLGFTWYGSLAWIAAAFALLLVASIAVGVLISAVSATTTQAVQNVMLVLLASLFFSGFFLDLDAIRYPFKAVAWFLPVTYGIRSLQDVMLRGELIGRYDLLGLALLMIVAAVTAWYLVRREMRAS